MNETTIRVAGKFVTIRQKSPGVPVEKWDAMRYEHRITVHVDGKYRVFSFYGSVFDYQNRRDMLGKGELVEVFWMLTVDASGLLVGRNVMDGVEEGRRHYIDIRRRFNELGFSDDDLYKVEAELIDMS